VSAIDPRLAGRPTPRRQPTDRALARYHATRRAANRALVAWLNTGPDATDIALEIDGATAILRQLASRGAP
jgi:hypothetical protein